MSNKIKENNIFNDWTDFWFYQIIFFKLNLVKNTIFTTKINYLWRILIKINQEGDNIYPTTITI